MFYEVEEAATFWESFDKVEALDNHERNGKAVNILTSWAVQHPLVAAPREGGIRILKLPSTYLDGGMTLPLRLAFYFDERPQPSGAAGTVLLLHVATYDEQQELLDGVTLPPLWH